MRPMGGLLQIVTTALTPISSVVIRATASRATRSQALQVRSFPSLLTLEISRARRTSLKVRKRRILHPVPVRWLALRPPPARLGRSKRRLLRGQGRIQTHARNPRHRRPSQFPPRARLRRYSQPRSPAERQRCHRQRQAAAAQVPRGLDPGRRHQLQSRPAERYSGPRPSSGPCPTPRANPGPRPSRRPSPGPVQTTTPAAARLW